VDFDAIAVSLALVRERIARAAERARRKPQEITLVAISKTFPAQAIRDAFLAGVHHFGENRVQEWESKAPDLTSVDAIWHLVGHLQSNKARRAAGLFDRIDSVDSFPLARRLDAAAAELAKTLPVLLEVKLDPEPGKSGAEPTNLITLAESVLTLPHVDLRGLMTIPPFFDDPEQVRPYFRRLRELRDAAAHHLERPLPELSMGMSHDYEVAIEEGATQVRIGTAIFGARP
jgi:pyridoxal phosphate enzyme (YggS family)